MGLFLFAFFSKRGVDFTREKISLPPRRSNLMDFGPSNGQVLRPQSQTPLGCPVEGLGFPLEAPGASGLVLFAFLLLKGNRFHQDIFLSCSKAIPGPEIITLFPRIGTDWVAVQTGDVAWLG